MPFVDAYGMATWTARIVFKALFKRMKAHEEWVEAEIGKVKTAISSLDDRLQRRIAACDRRIDDLHEEHGGPP
jgi:hypothetical protein